MPLHAKPRAQTTEAIATVPEGVPAVPAVPAVPVVVAVATAIPKNESETAATPIDDAITAAETAASHSGITDD